MVTIDSPCKNIHRSHTHTHTEREQHPRHRHTHTHTRQEHHPKPPNEHLTQTLNTARRWRDNGECTQQQPDSLVAHLRNRTIDSPCECAPNLDSLDSQLFPSVMSAVAPAVTIDEASSLSGLLCSHSQTVYIQKGH